MIQGDSKKNETRSGLCSIIITQNIYKKTNLISMKINILTLGKHENISYVITPYRTEGSF